MLESFECIVMSAIRVKVLVAIDIRNKVIQARNMTLDVEETNTEDLLKDLQKLRDQWNNILEESKLTTCEYAVRFAY